MKWLCRFGLHWWQKGPARWKTCRVCELQKISKKDANEVKLIELGEKHERERWLRAFGSSESAFWDADPHRTAMAMQRRAKEEERREIARKIQSAMPQPKVKPTANDWAKKLVEELSR